jgi:multidrug resistance protein
MRVSFEAHDVHSILKQANITRTNTLNKEKDASITTPQPETELPVPYTVFTTPEKHLITLIMGLAMFFSPFTANIYFPNVPTLATAFSVSLEKINLTITAYIVVQGVAPLFIGDLADKIGRRPVYLLTFAIYIGASVGLSCTRESYATLVVLRMLQSAGCSATAAISYGVLADVSTPANRGQMLGAAMVAANTGPTTGPLLGGIISDKLGWRWVFWFLTIFGASFWVTVYVLFPETSRKIVKNGSILPPRWNRPLLSLVRTYPKHVTEKVQDAEDVSCRHREISIPNPLPALRIILYQDASLVLWISAVHYMAYYCLQATMPTVFSTLYELTDLQIGLTYLAIGVGVALGGFINGKFLDINYRRTAKDCGFAIDKVAGDDLRTFPIERARTRFAYGLIAVHAAVLSAYGWACFAKAHISIPIILQFVLGFIQTCIVQTFNTLLVDIFSSNPSTASASGNITRCALSAGGIAAVQPLLQRLGFGWVFTLLGCFSGVSALATTRLIRSVGMRLRNRRNTAVAG